MVMRFSLRLFRVVYNVRGDAPYRAISVPDVKKEKANPPSRKPSAGDAYKLRRLRTTEFVKDLRMEAGVIVPPYSLLFFTYIFYTRYRHRSSSERNTRYTGAKSLRVKFIIRFVRVTRLGKLTDFVFSLFAE